MSTAHEAHVVVGGVPVGGLLGERYRIMERVGSGGMAVIYRARDELLERDVAVKVLHTHLADDEAVLGRFRTEARHAAALVHPHVVTVYDQGLGAMPYIVMELVDGPSLREVVRARGPLGPGELLAVADPVCRALTKAHEVGVVHRDVKPENVLVTSDGVVKVADFGIARAAWAADHTQTGTLVGSVHYLAPELVAGHEATPATDQYAVGVLLFELLTGQKPLPAETPVAVALRHGREPIPAPSTARADIPPAVDAVVARATAMRASDRYPDLRVLADALIAAVPGGPEPVWIPTGDADSTTVVIAPLDRTPNDIGPLPPVAPVSPNLVDAREHATLVGITAPDSPGTALGIDLEDLAVDHDAPEVRSGLRTALLATLRWLVATLVLVGLGAGGAWLAYDRLLLPVRTVPNVEGRALDDAQRRLSSSSLGMETAPGRHDYEAPEGTVLSQSPEPDTQLRSGEAVTLTPSLGPPPVDVPNVSGLSEDQAVALLTGDPYRFVVSEFHHAHHDQIPEGHVIAIDLTGEVPARSPVTVRLSLGVEQIEVPDVVGRDVADAESRLVERGFEVLTTEAWSDDYPDPGTVAVQSLEADTEVDRGSEITLTVSRGALTITVPRLEREAVEDAVAEIEARGLVAEVREQARPSIGPFRQGQFGRVEAQIPEPGEEVRRGDTVRIWTFSREAEEAERGS